MPCFLLLHQLYLLLLLLLRANSSVLLQLLEHARGRRLVLQLLQLLQQLVQLQQLHQLQQLLLQLAAAERRRCRVGNWKRKELQMQMN